MKRPARLVLLFALLAAGGFALRAHLAAARDRELAELLDGPLLPGAADVREIWRLSGRVGTPSVGRRHLISVLGASFPELGADLVRRRGLLDPDGGDDNCPHDEWWIGAGTRTEGRFLGFLRADPFVEGLAEREKPGGIVSWWNLKDGGLPPESGFAEFSGTARTDQTELQDFRDRLDAFLEGEAAREDVVFREERTEWSLAFIHAAGIVEPPHVKRAVGRICDWLGLEMLEPVSDWAAGGWDMRSDDPLSRLQFVSFLLVDGAPAPGLRRFAAVRADATLPTSFDVADGTPLAAAIRKLFETDDPRTIGDAVPPGFVPPPYCTALHGRDGTNRWMSALERPTPKVRAFLSELVRLLAAPPAAAADAP